MKVLCAMSGGVDSSVAAAVLLQEGHDVVGATLKLWGGESDTGCCSVSDVDDARRVARTLGIDHHVWNLGHRFEADVVGHYLDAHSTGRTPNPCIECNRHIKFDALTQRARALGFDAVATGHHAQVVAGPRLARGADRAKDQSYVVYPVIGGDLDRVLFPIGSMTKSEVRTRAADLGLVTAAKPDSQEVCFVASTVGRAGFVGRRRPLTPGVVVDTSGTPVGQVAAVELVTVGQRRGLGGLGGAAEPRFAVDVDVERAMVTVGSATDLLVDSTPLTGVVWASAPEQGAVYGQTSAHGEAALSEVKPHGDGRDATVHWAEPHRRVAPGQAVVLYAADDTVVAGGTAT